MKSQLKRITTVLCAVLLLSGCSTGTVKQIPDNSDVVPLVMTAPQFVDLDLANARFLMKIQVSKQGKVTSVELLDSTGLYGEELKAIQTAMRRWYYKPHVRDNTLTGFEFIGEFGFEKNDDGSIGIVLLKTRL